MTITTTQTINRKSGNPSGGPARIPVIAKKNPPFTLGQLKAAVPAHCFKHNLLTSFRYLAVDLLEVVACLFLILYLDDLTKGSTLLNWACWITYWFYQGVTMTGLWVLAHECGHGGFVAYEWLNDTVGLIVHSCLYVPYFSWKFSHAKHHHYTNNLEMDEVFVPAKVGKAEKEKIVKGEIPHPNVLSPWDLWQRFGVPTVMLTLGWPLYLAINSSGPTKQRWTSHYDPTASIFNRKDQFKIVLSDLGLVAWTFAIYKLMEFYGVGLIVCLYVLPLMVTNSFLVSITYLQHTDERIPHYDSEEWTWLRGALCTVDRSLGSFWDYKLHHIADTHVTHHIFSYLPFYNAQEASKAIVPILKQYHCEDKKKGFFNFWASFWADGANLNSVEGENGILHFFRDEIMHNK